jgi:hypothetical protein
MRVRLGPTTYLLSGAGSINHTVSGQVNTAGGFPLDQEQRCQDLGGTCVVSERCQGPLNKDSGNAGGYRFLETHVKPPASPLGQGTGDFGEQSFGLQRITTQNISPLGQVAGNFAPQASDAGFQGHYFGAGLGSSVLNARWYEFYASDWIGNPSAKGFMLFDNNGSTQRCFTNLRQFIGTTFPFPNAVDGDHIQYNDTINTEMPFQTGQNKVWRYEIRIDNNTNTFMFWAKNITDSQSEIVLSANASGVLGPRSISGDVEAIAINNNSSAGTDGGRGWSWYMGTVTSDTNFRIGSAAEVEGTAGSI